MPAGRFVISGSTSANNLPVTQGAYEGQCACTHSSPAGFAAKLAAGGAKLIWGTYLGPIQPASLALDPSSNVVLIGSTTSNEFPITAGALQPAFPPAGSPLFLAVVPTAGFLAKLDASGSTLLFSTYFGGNVTGVNVLSLSIGNGPGALAIDPQGTIWITGSSALNALPVNHAVPLGQNFIAGISGDGASLLTLFTAPLGAAGTSIAITPQGSLGVVGPIHSLLISSPQAGPALMGIAASVSFHVAETISPLELVSFYGIGIGPSTALTAPTVPNGTIPRSLGGVQVLFDGAPAALLYAGPTQINAIVPSSVLSKLQSQTAIQIVTPSGTIEGPAEPVDQYTPVVFTDASTDALALNQDGTLNSPSNPAASQSIVSIWATGRGALSPYAVDDNMVNPSFQLLPLSSPVSVLAGGLSLNTVYAGDAPGLPIGVIQINFQLRGAPNGTGLATPIRLNLEVGPAISEPFNVYER